MRKMSSVLAVPLIGTALVLRITDELTWYVGYYQDLIDTLNPLRARAGYAGILTPGGVRKGLEAAKGVYDVRIEGRHAPVLVHNSPLIMEAVIRRVYGQEVQNQWRQILYEHKYPLADEAQLSAVFGPELPPFQFPVSPHQR